MQVAQGKIYLFCESIIFLLVTLSNLPTYFLSLFHLSSGVAHRLEKIQRDFLWNGMSDQPKYHVVKWVKLCEPISSDGLGVKNLRCYNQTL
jgi:hypothetical protein